jgi:hypothetical protein
MTDERLDRPSGASPEGAGTAAATPIERPPTPAPAAEREPPSAPPPAPPATGEARPPGGGPPERRPRPRDGRGVPILGIVLVLLGLGLLAERLVPGLELGVVWPYGSIAFGLVLVLASIRFGDGA